MNWELERNFVDPNSSTGHKFGVGVTGSTSTSLNPSVGRIILAGGSSICATNIFEDSMGTRALSSSANRGGWKKRILWEQKLCTSWFFYGYWSPVIGDNQAFCSMCARTIHISQLDQGKCTQAVALGQVLVQIQIFLVYFKVLSDDKSFNLLFDSFHIRL